MPILQILKWNKFALVYIGFKHSDFHSKIFKHYWDWVFNVNFFENYLRQIWADIVFICTVYKKARFRFMLSQTLSPEAFRNEFANLSCYISMSVYTQTDMCMKHSLSCVCTFNHVCFLASRLFLHSVPEDLRILMIFDTTVCKHDEFWLK